MANKFVNPIKYINIVSDVVLTTHKLPEFKSSSSFLQFSKYQ